MRGRLSTVALMAALVALMAPSSDAAISAPGAVPASGCRSGGVFSTDEFTTTGFSQVRTVGPNAQAPAGAWVLADDEIPTTSVTTSPNCPVGGDTWSLFVVALKLTPTIGNWQDADIEELKLVQDTNRNANFEPGQDLVLQTRSGEELREEGGNTFFNGPQSPLFVIPDGEEFGIMVVVEIGSNPTSGAQFGLMLEAMAADVPGRATNNISSAFSSSRNPAGSSIRLQLVGGEGNGGSTPPPGGGGGGSVAQQLGSYDANGNDRLEDREFLNAVNDWVDRELSNNAFFAAIDIWTQQKPISSASVADGAARVQTRMTSQGVRFAATNASSLSVEVFDLNGRPIFSGSTSGSALGWSLQALNGAPVANGVYLYRTTLTTAEGVTVRRGMRKLFVQR